MGKIWGKCEFSEASVKRNNSLVKCALLSATYSSLGPFEERRYINMVIYLFIIL